MFKRLICLLLAFCLFGALSVTNAEDTALITLQERLLTLGYEIGAADGILRTVKNVAKETKETVEKAVKTPAKKAVATKLNIQIQSPMGGVITPEQIAEKVPKEAVDVYVRVDENKIYWVGKKGVGSVDIWE